MRCEWRQTEGIDLHSWLALDDVVVADDASDDVIVDDAPLAPATAVAPDLYDVCELCARFCTGGLALLGGNCGGLSGAVN